MQRSILLLPLTDAFLAFGLALSSSPALAATTDFTITATSVVMSSNGSSGTGSTTFTLTSVNGYTGSVQVVCDPPTPPVGTTIPYCGGGPVSRAYPLTANGTAKGSISFTNVPVPEAAASLPSNKSPGKSIALGLASLLFLGLRFRLKAARWFTLVLLAVVTLVGLSGFVACGGSSSAVTPGTYDYVIKATDINTSASVSTSIGVTVP